MFFAATAYMYNWHTTPTGQTAGDAHAMGMMSVKVMGGVSVLVLLFETGSYLRCRLRLRRAAKAARESQA